MVRVTVFSKVRQPCRVQKKRHFTPLFRQGRVHILEALLHPERLTRNMIIETKNSNYELKAE